MIVNHGSELSRDIEKKSFGRNLQREKLISCVPMGCRCSIYPPSDLTQFLLLFTFLSGFFFFFFPVASFHFFLQVFSDYFIFVIYTELNLRKLVFIWVQPPGNRFIVTSQSACFQFDHTMYMCTWCDCTVIQLFCNDRRVCPKETKEPPKQVYVVLLADCGVVIMAVQPLL